MHTTYRHAHGPRAKHTFSTEMPSLRRWARYASEVGVVGLTRWAPPSDHGAIRIICRGAPGTQRARADVLTMGCSRAVVEHGHREKPRKHSRARGRSESGTDAHAPPEVKPEPNCYTARGPTAVVARGERRRKGSGGVDLELRRRVSVSTPNVNVGLFRKVGSKKRAETFSNFDSKPNFETGSEHTSTCSHRYCF